MSFFDEAYRFAALAQYLAPRVEYGSAEWYEQRIKYEERRRGGESHIPTTVQCEDCVGQEVACARCTVEQDFWIARLADIRGDSLVEATITQESLAVLQRRAT